MTSNSPAASFLDSINLNPTLQAGLTRNAEGDIVVKPDIQKVLKPEIAERIRKLLFADRLSEANSLAGCRHIFAGQSKCPDNHELMGANVVCAKPLLCEDDATAESGVHKFAYQNSGLYDHLMRTSWELMTFTMPASGRGLHWDLVDGRDKFISFRAELEGSNGCRWIAGFGYELEETEFRVIYQGDRLPHWPTLQALWRRIAGNSANIKIRTYDGKDGDDQRVGMRIAHSGFENYWRAVHAGKADELAISREFQDEDLSQLYGTFRGFRKTVIPQPEPLKCGTCGKDHVSCKGLMLTSAEAIERFDHMVLPTYGQRRRWASRNYLHMPLIDVSPPPG